jgi:uncharacterized protein (DUF433 family)
MSKHQLISSSKDILGGTPVFKGTRVPVAILFDYLEGKETINDFLEDFPTVSNAQVLELLEQLKNQALHSTKVA